MMGYQERVLGILSQVAQDHGVSLETVLEEINQIIENGLRSEDAQVRAQ